MFSVISGSQGFIEPGSPEKLRGLWCPSGLSFEGKMVIKFDKFLTKTNQTPTKINQHQPKNMYWILVRFGWVLFGFWWSFFGVRSFSMDPLQTGPVCNYIDLISYEQNMLAPAPRPKSFVSAPLSGLFSDFGGILVRDKKRHEN